MHTSKHSQTKKYRILHSKQLSHTHTQSNTRVTHRHNHRHHHKHTHRIPVTSCSVRVHTHTHSHSHTNTGHTPSHLPIACFPPSPQVPHTKPPSPSPQTLQTDRAAPGPWGAAPSPACMLEPEGPGPGGGGGALSAGGATLGQLGNPGDKGGGPGVLCPGTLDQARGWRDWGLPEIVLILFRLGWGGVPGTGPCFEKGLCLGHRPRIGGMLCPGCL